MCREWFRLKKRILGDYMKTILNVLLAVSVISLACGKKKDGDTGSIKVGFSNAGSSSLALLPAGSSGTITDKNDIYARLAYPATTYATKLVQIYLSEDVDPVTLSNKGEN